MPLYPTILCAVDFSEHSRLALRLALDLGRRNASRVIAFHTIDLLLAGAAAAAYDERRLKHDAETELRALLDALAPEGRRAEVSVEVGRPEQTIVAAAREQKADLIVVGTQGLGGLRKMFFGSVTEKVLRDAEVPVLAVTAAGEGESRIAFGGVLAAVELDASIEGVLRHAAALAGVLDLPLTVVHVVRPLSALPQYTSALGAAQEAHVREARAQLQQAGARADPRATTEVLTGSPAETIASRAQAAGGQIVVIGLGGGRMLRRPGSTAYRVLALANTPVVGVP